jgi:hypothetical protein
MVSAFVVYNRAISAAGAGDKAKRVSQANMQREITYFTEKAQKITTADEFLSDRRMMKFALSAFSMESEMQYMGRMKKVLLADQNDNRSIIYQMYDQRYKTINKYFDLTNSGVQKLKDPKLIADLVQRYSQNDYEDAISNQNSAAGDALYFKRNAGGVKNMYQIIADQGLRGVIARALDIPDGSVMYSVDRQIKVMEARGLDVTKMGDEAYVDGLIKKFLAKSDLKDMKKQSNALLDIFA